ncbi:2-isopropylmalate synthase (plasmid) [Streptomyces sp. PCS3-D2]|uniref:2-isopropylmalate synthase n=1 Tax=Streptomyces sp. PCS3-D2 TaxID=1460244 RepID=UPI00044C7D43|nr:2-isopropylmalate synthase [Streptomyces sp. PCS3-D2]WKV76540.1 2-isopropylmalate synthase [Streptomyces sp. PCS3-D2]
MTEAPPSPLTAPGIRTPAGPHRTDQPWWNAQRGSAMPFQRYNRTAPRLPQELTDRTWPSNTLVKAPLWASVDLRDGNQALSSPMDIERKTRMFDLLVRMGFKDIEVGYPSASEADFSFLRTLIKQDRIPDDVTISVFTPARPELIDRTFEAIEGADRAMVHLCNATACLWRDVVFGMTADEVQQMALRSAERIARHADAAKGTRLRFEYSPETFNVTEPEFVLEVSNSIISLWDASPDRPVTLNLPTTVETDSPHVFADQVEWMHRNLERRDAVVLSVHPHNDRGTAVAAAELAVLAGADRIEGTLFGNGERTGNVCLATLGLNLFSQGVDPQLDFSDIDQIRSTVEFANQMPIGARHPYVGDLVYTAFSGTHQDAIAKGLADIERQAAEAGTTTEQIPWDVPYLPIDPKDVGRTYESVVRVNSQSGKGGVAHVLKSVYGLDLPRGMRVELAKEVQAVADGDGIELTSRQLHAVFSRMYLDTDTPALVLKEFEATREAAATVVDALVVDASGLQTRITGTGPDIAAAYTAALAAHGIDAALTEITAHPVSDSLGTRYAAYARLALAGATWYGAALAGDEDTARLAAVTSAVNRARA